MKIKIEKLPIEYSDSLEFMESYVKRIINNNASDLAWIIEHPNIYTYGTLANKKDLLNPDIFPVIKTNRGGEFTYHGPGQSVVYLMVNLEKQTKDIKLFINSIENLIINVLSQVGLPAVKNNAHHGIFIKHNEKIYKIASIGVKFKKWISSHGFSINVNPNLSNYSGIRPCGLENNLVTSIANEGINIDHKLFNDILIEELKKFNITG